jgi:magnesium-transporting ATPase (P-type)
MKPYPNILSWIFQRRSVIVWLMRNAPLLLCLLWYPMTIGYYGVSHFELMEPALRSMSRLLGWDLLVTSALTMFILVYSVTVVEGWLVGIAWAARRRWTDNWLWRVLMLGIVVGLSATAANTTFFSLFSLLGLLALCSQGLTMRHVPLILAGLILLNDN